MLVTMFCVVLCYIPEYHGPLTSVIALTPYLDPQFHTLFADDKPRGADKSKEAVESSWLSQREGESVDGGLRLNAGEGLKSPYDNINIYYKDMTDETVYPPQLGYAEFESPDVLGSTSSLAQEHGTDTFSELLFSSSNSESEEPDENFPASREYETCGILYDMSNHINKVPEMFVQGVSPAERAELKELEESISQMLIDIRREESLFYADKTEETDTIKRRPKPKKHEGDDKYKKISEDGETALKEIESHISKLLEDVEKEEREIMGSPSCTPSPVESSSTSEDEYAVVPRVELNIGSRLGKSTIDISVKNSPTSRRKSTRMSASKRSLNRSLPSLKSSSMSLVWRDHNSSECLLEGPTIWQSSSVEYISPPQRIDPGSGYCVWSYPSEEEYGQDQVREEVKTSPIPEKHSPPKDEKLSDKGKRDDWKKEPIKKNEKPSLDKKDSIKKMSPDKTPEPPKKVSPGKMDSAKRISPDKTPEPSKKVSPVKIDSTKRISPDKTPEPSKKVPPVKMDSTKRISPDKTPEPPKKVSPVKNDKKPMDRGDSKKTPSPEKSVSIVKEKTVVTKVKSTEESTTATTEKNTIKTETSETNIDEKQVEIDSSKQKSTEKTKKESTKSETTVKEKVVEVKGKGKQKKEKNGESGGTKEVSKKPEEKETKQLEQTKGSSTEKKTSILGKTLETIKKPFQGKGKQKSFDSTKSLSQDIDESVDVREVSPKPNEKKPDTSKSVPQAEASKTFITAESSQCIEVPVAGTITVEESVTITSKASDDDGKNGRLQDDKSKEKSKGKKVPEPPKISPLTRATSQEKEESKKPVKQQSVERVSVVEPLIEKAVQDMAVIAAGSMEKVIEDKTKKDDEGSPKEDKTKGKGKGKDKQGLAKTPSFEESDKTQKLSDKMTVVEPLIEQTTQDVAVVAMGGAEKVLEGKAKKDEKASPKDDKNKGKGKAGPKKTPSVEESDKTLKSSDTMTAVEPLIEHTTQDIAVIALGSVEKVMEGKAKKDEKGSKKDNKNNGKGKGKSGPEKTPSVEEVGKTQKTADRTTVVEPLIEKITQDVTVIAVGSVDKIDDKRKKDEKGNAKDDKNKGKGKSGPPKTPSVEEADKTQRTADGTTAVQPLIEKITQDIAVVAAVGSVDEIDVKGKKDEKGSPKDDKNKGKGKSGPSKTPSVEKLEKSQKTADRTTVVEPLIEKTAQDVAVVAVGSLEKALDSKVMKQQEGSPKDDKKQGKGKGKSGLAKTTSVDDSKETPKQADRTTVVEPLIEKTAQDVAVVAVGSLEKALDSKVMKQQEGSPKDDKKQGKGKGKSGLAKTSSVDDSKETPKQADRTTVVEPLIEKTIQDIAVIAVGSVDKKKGSPKDDKNKGKGKEKGETGPTKTHSVDESDKPQQSTTSKIGETVEMIKEPFPDQTSAAQKSKKGKKQKSVELPKSSSLDKGDVDETKVELAQPKSATQIGEMAAKSSFEESDKELDKPAAKTEGKGKQKSVVPIKTPSPEKSVTSQIESKTKNVIDKPISTEPTKKEEKKKAKEKTLETIKRPFQGKKDDKAEAEGKKGKGKSKQKSVDSRQSSTEQEPKEEIRMTTETVRLIKELSQDASGQVIEQQAISLVVEPFGDKPSLSKSDDTRPSTEGSAKTKALIKELSLEKTGQQIEEKAMGLVSKPFERNDEKLSLAETVTSSKSTVEREWSLEDGGKVIAEKEIDLVTKPLQEGLSTHFQHPAIAKVEPLITELAHEKSGFFIEERPIDLVSQPFQDILETTSIEEPPVPTKSKTQSESATSISGPLIKELSHEKSGFIIEERAIDLVSQPFQNILETSLTHPNPPEDTRKQSKPERETVTAPLIRELSHEKSGFIIEERPIDLVSQPFQEILESSLISSPIPSVDSKIVSKTPREETTPDTKPLIKELAHEKSGFIIEERPIDLVSQPFQEILGSSSMSSPIPSVDSKIVSKTPRGETTPDTKPLIKELAHEKSGFIIEERPIDLVSQPFQEILGSSLMSSPIPSVDSKIVSKTPREETTPDTRPLIKELAHEKSGFIIEERAIDLVSQPFQGIFEAQKSIELPPSGSKGTKSPTMSKERSPDKGRLIEGKASGKDTKSLEDIRKLPPSSLEGSTKAVSLMKELSQDKSGQVIEEGAIDLVAQPFLGNLGRKEGNKTKKKEGKSKGGDSKKGAESPVKKNDFEHIQKTIDEAKVQFDQFVGIVSDKAGKSTSGKTKETDSSSTVSVTTTTMGSSDVTGGDMLQSDEQEIEIPVEKEEDFLKIQRSIQHDFQNLPSEITGTFDVKKITTTTKKPLEQEVGAFSSQIENVIGGIDRDMKKVTETMTKSVDGGITIVEKSVESHVKPVKEVSTKVIEKSAVTIQENISKIGETIPQKIGTVELTTITTTVTEPIKKGVESIPVQGEKVLGTVEKDLEKVKESVTKEVTVGERTIESQMKLVKDASSSFVKNTEKGPVNDAVEGLDRLAQTSMETVDKSKILTKGVVEDVGRTAEAIGQEAVGKVTNIFNSRGGVGRTDSESSPPELRAQSVKIAKFETVETIPQTVTEGDGTTRIRSKVTITGSSNNDEIGRIIKEMESQLLSTKFGTDEMVDDGSEVESDDFTKESRTTPSTPMPARKLFGDVESISDSEGVSMPYVTTPTLSRRVIGVGGSQRLSQDERPVVRVITEYVGDLSESEPEEDTYTVLEPEVKERRKFKIRFSPDMYGSEDKDDVEEMLRSDSEVASEALKKSDSIKSEKNIQRIERKFERMSSKTTEADPSMTELTEGEFQRIVSQLSLEEMDQALHQWDAGGLTPSEIDSKDLTLSSDDTTSPLQQGLTDIFRPKLSSILPTSVYVEKTGAEVGSSGFTESSKMKLSKCLVGVLKLHRQCIEPVESTTTQPPKPKPRARTSISQSIDLEEKKAVSHSEASIDQEVSEIGESGRVFHGVTTTESVVRDFTTEREISLDADTSEMEFIKSHDKEEMSYDNDAFDAFETTKDLPYPEPKPRKNIYERSVSLPGDTTIDVSNSVRSKKRIFETQIKKEMVVEQLMSQMEEEGSPEHKAFAMTTEPTDQAAMLNRQIHSEIVSHELEEQIESNLLENKALVQTKREIENQKDVKQNTAVETSPMKLEDDASESDKTNESSELPSIYETKISSTVAEVLHYKNDAISKPSDSLEVHVDKSESEETEKVKDIEEDLRVLDEKYESRPQTGSDQAKVSSITSSQGESEDTFSESDVTPEDARFKEQHDIHVWGPSDKDVKLSVDKLEDQKRTRSVHTPEEHIPDTVWEVPVQESTEPLEVETVGQLPTAVASWEETESLTESEARKIAEIFVGEIENELINTEALALDTQVSEKDGSKTKSPEAKTAAATKKSVNMLKLVRTDTTTSSMEITDEDLRSSGMTDNSPLESQAGLGLLMTGQRDVFGEDSGDDVDAQELDGDTIGKEVVEKTLAEVKQSLEAVKEELIEEKKKKRDSITKESPSEFEFKALVLEKTFSESIQEHLHEEATTIESKSLTKSSDESFSTRIETSEVSHVEKIYSTIEESSTSRGSEVKTTVQEITFENIAKYQEPVCQTSYEEISKREESKFEEYETSSVDTTTSYSKSTDYDMKEPTLEPKEIKTPGSTTGSEVSTKSTKSQETVIDRQEIDKQGSSAPHGEVDRSDTVMSVEDKKDEPVSQIKSSLGITERSSRPDLDSFSDQPVETEERKSPLDDVFSNSSSSDYKGGSNDASTLDKPNIIIRKHKKSSLGTKDPKSDGEPYSSSGSHYESFEQTSDSIKSPGSRPLSSDIEGLVAASTGMTTGSSEYETAVSHEISGQSTTITSREYQTAVSSLSSRDSMKSLDSESSGNLASIEVSSEASETLVPSAMELEKDSEEPIIKQKRLPPFTVDNQAKVQSFSESIEQSVSFDISGEDISEDDDENQVQPDQEQAIRMKRSHEMTFQPEPRPIVLEGESSQVQDEKLVSSLDDMSSLVSTATDTGGNRTIIELSKTESERMDGSATSEQLSLTVSGTSDMLSSESREFEETTVLSRTETIATQSPPFQQSAGGVESVTITTSSIVEQGIQSVCTQVTSKVEIRDVSHSNGPTQVEYNAEYDEGDHEVKKRGHRRNGSTSFRPSMIPVFQERDTSKKSEDIIEDSAESDKYTQPLTVKEGTQEEKKDVDETEKPEEEFYKTEADQAMNRDLREGRISIADTSYGEGAKSFDSSFGTKSRLHSAAFSDDHPDSEIAELLKQCSTDIPSEDPIERPKTPEPVEECELKDDTPEFSSEAQASVTELEMEYSGAFSRSAEYAAHVSPIREKELPEHESWEHLSEGEQTIDDSMIHSPDPLHLGFDNSASEKHELETHESTSKEKSFDRSKYVSSPVPDITVTQHMHPTPQDSFEKIEMDSASPSEISKQSVVQDSSENAGKSKEISDETEGRDSASDSPTSDSFELLEKPDIADEFVIIEEVGREASEQDTEGKSIKIDMKRVTSRVGSSSAPTVISPPTTVTKMTQMKYFSSGATEEDIPFDFDSGSPAKSAKSEKQSSQEGSPPSVEEPDFKPDLEASKKWMEMQFQGTEPIAQIYGYEDPYDRGGPLEDIKEEDINDLEGSSRIGSMGSQVSQSIGSFGSVKESLSSTPDYDVLAGRKFFTRSGEHDDVSMSSLQEFERLENLIALESSKHKSLGSQDSLTSSSNNSRKHGSRSGGDDISLASLKEFEGLESACIAAERIEKKAKLEEETLLSEIEEGHESQASESESCATISVGGMQRGESDEDDYERRMFEIDEIIRQAQTNVEQFMDSKNRETIEGGLKSETLGRADSLEEISKVPELDLDLPLYSVSYSSGKSYIQQWEDLGDDLVTSTDSLELKTQKSKTSVVDPFTTSTDSLDVKISQDVMSVSTDSIEASQKAKKKDIMTDSIEVGEKTSMLTSVDSLEGKVTQANSIDEDELHALGTYDQSSSSGKEGDLSSSGKDDSAEGAVGMNRMPPPRAEYLLGSTDSLEPTSSTATHATYQYETDSVMSSSFTSGDSTTMVDDNDEEGAARASMWFDEGKPYVTEVIEPIIGDEEFSHVIHRKVEMPPEIHKVSFKGMEAEHALREYIEKFDPGEDCTETREVDEHGNVHVKRVIQKRVIVRPEELGGDTTDLSGPDLEKYLQTLTQSQMETEPLIDSVHSSSESHSTVTSTLRTTTTLSQGDSIKTEQEVKQTVETHRRERDEESQEGAYGFSESKTKGTKK
ncbi:hypothetical protein GE061_016992 [Apolygus lucorum]|uniref:Uncharacterized protein n=1 Tax=Apolygus lucorum TaxID=248454 RepID=A0A8S9XJ03_APOLU|nr:hypothetical protein GE061_016992 [Apolygus lucorum]